jgi:hypothetical protein
MKVFCAAIICLQIGFVIFWFKNFGAKAAHKMLVKLTPGCQLDLPSFSWWQGEAGFEPLLSGSLVESSTTVLPLLEPMLLKNFCP